MTRAVRARGPPHGVSRAGLDRRRARRHPASAGLGRHGHHLRSARRGARGRPHRRALRSPAFALRASARQARLVAACSHREPRGRPLPSSVVSGRSLLHSPRSRHFDEGESEMHRKTWAIAVVGLVAGSVAMGWASQQAPAQAPGCPAARRPGGRGSDSRPGGTAPTRRYKATIKGLTQFGDRREGTQRNRDAVAWIAAQLKSYGCEPETMTYVPPAARAGGAGQAGAGRAGQAGRARLLARLARRSAGTGSAGQARARQARPDRARRRRVRRRRARRARASAPAVPGAVWARSPNRCATAKAGRRSTVCAAARA